MTSVRALQERSPLDPHVEDPDDLVVEVAGRSLRGWKDISITRRMDAASGSFDLSIQHVEPWPIIAGAEVRILAGKTLVMTGFVDEIRAALEPDRTDLSVSGRDRTEDLVDCTVPEDLAELRNVLLAEVAERLAEPLEVEVLDARKFFEGIPESEIFTLVRFNQGETCWSAIERACRKRSTLAYADEQGRLILQVPGARQADGAVVYGSNLLKAELAWTQLDRFQVYVVTGQRPGSDSSYGAAVAEVRAEAKDLDIERPRRMVKIAEGIVDQKSAEDYAQWLATVRAARSAVVTARVLGWRQTPGGRPWAVNELVPVRIPRWRLGGDRLLVNAVRFQYPPRVTVLELVRPDAYSPEPQVDPSRSLTFGWGKDELAPDLEEDE